MNAAQIQLFDDPPEALPEGMRYEEAVVPPDEEQALARFIAALPLAPFEFTGGFKGHRRIVSFGWSYDFNAHKLAKADEIPPLLLRLRDRAAGFAAMPAEHFQQVLVTEYAPGAGIGWHKDRSVFADVIGVSLLAPCKFRMRRKRGEKWERRSFIAQPRSAYLLSGAARKDWEHSIPPLDALRYSVTYRNLRAA